MSQNIYFQSDTYSTSPSTGETSFFRCFGRSRLFFTVRFLKIVFRTRRAALKGKYKTEEWAQSSYDIFKILEQAGANFNVSGLDNIREADAPVVFIANHMSTLETMILPCLIAPFMDLTSVVKESLVSHFLFGPVMRSRSPIVVSRDNSREDLTRVINEGSAILGSGRSIVIFPQSTRRLYFSATEFNTLGIKLAAKNNATIIPVALKTDFWLNGKIVKDLGPFNREADVYFKFGKPIKASGRGKEEQKKVVDFIESNLKSWGAQAPSLIE